MGKNIKREGLTVAVILLFIGLAVSPSIYADTTPEEEYVEFTTEVCGLSGYEPKTIRLTQEEADEVDKVFENLRVQLNGTVSLEETVEIYTDAVDELDRFGLLGDMSVHMMKRLIQRHYKLLKGLETFKDKLNFENKPLEEDVYENRFCFINGVVENCLVSGHSIVIFWIFRSFINFYVDILSLFFFTYRVLIRNLYPIHIFKILYFGSRSLFYYPEYPPEPSRGWLSTSGLNGEWLVNSSFIGKIFPDTPIAIYYYLLYPGVLGFCGLGMYNSDTKERFILGIGTRVGIKTI